MFRREILIENQADFVVLSIRNAAGSWIKSRVSHCQKSGSEALASLRKVQKSRETLDAQWDDEVHSLTARAARPSKENVAILDLHI